MGGFSCTCSYVYISVFLCVCTYLYIHIDMNMCIGVCKGLSVPMCELRFAHTCTYWICACF